MFLLIEEQDYQERRTAWNAYIAQRENSRTLLEAGRGRRWKADEPFLSILLRLRYLGQRTTAD